MLRRFARAALAVIALGPLGAIAAGTAAQAVPALPPIRHVWIIVLENENYGNTFGSPSTDPYLARTLPHKGVKLTQYYGIGHESNDNYLAMVSGQPPNPDTQADCHTFTGFVPDVVQSGIETGTGCVYPSSIRTIGNQLTKRGLSWKAYEQDMGNDPKREAAACGHPALNSQDKTQKAEPGDGYATRHDPFVYFTSVIGSAAYCARRVVAMGDTHGKMPASARKGETGLATDLRALKTTPTYSFITPNLCRDGHDYPCKNQKGAGSSLANIDAFLQAWVPKIMASRAYQHGLIEIIFDESGGAQSDSTACCGETAGPASPLPGITGPGGGRTGAVLLSPYIKAGTKSTVAYNHYSMLATDEKLFGLPLLGEARTVTSTFGSDVFTGYSG